MKKEFLDEEEKSIRHSEEVNAIITNIPVKILFLGKILFSSVFLLLVSLLWFIRYPDIIKTKLTINKAPVANYNVFAGDIQIQQGSFHNVHQGDIITIVLNSRQSKQQVSIRAKLESLFLKSTDDRSIVKIQIRLIQETSESGMHLPIGTTFEANIITQDLSIFSRIINSSYNKI